MGVVVTASDTSFACVVAPGTGGLKDLKLEVCRALPCRCPPLHAEYMRWQCAALQVSVTSPSMFVT
jgi:hypothetical protein